MRIVTDNVIFDEQVRKYGRDAERAHFCQVIHNWFGAIRGVSPTQGGRDWARIQDRDIKELPAGMFMQGAYVVGGGIAAGFAGLSHEVAHINFERPGACDLFGNPANQQVGYE